MSERGRLRVAIVGAGLMGRWHADAAARAGATVALIVDPSPDRARTLAAQYGARAEGAWRGAEVDAAHICTPLETHVTLASAAIESGAHVLVEKPLAATRAETARLLDVAAACGRVLCPVHQFLFQPGAQEMLEAAESIAPIRHVDLLACTAGAEHTVSDVERDAVLGEILPHPLSLVRRLFGALPAAWQVSHPAPGELRCSATHAGATLSIVVSTHGRPTTNGMRVIGDRGTIHVDLFHGFAVVEGSDVSRLRKIAHPFALSAATLAAATVNLGRRAIEQEPAYPGLRELVRDFYDAAAGKRSSPVGRDEVLDVADGRDEILGAIGTA